MKKFNFSKGLVIGLLTLALCLTCFAAAKVSAETTYPTIQFNLKVDGTSDWYRCAPENLTSSYNLKVLWGTKFKSDIDHIPGDDGYSTIGSLTNVTINPVGAATVDEATGIVTVNAKDGGISYLNADYEVIVSATVVLDPHAVVATTFNVTIDEKVFTYTRAASSETKWPVVSKADLLANAKNAEGKSISELYDNVALTLTTAADTGKWVYSAPTGGTTIKFNATEALAIEFTATGESKVEVPHYVTFTVKAPTSDEGAYEDYTFVSELSAKDDATTLADILDAATKPGATEEADRIPLEDASAWILDTRAGKSKDLLKSDEFVSFTASDGSFKVKKALTADKEVEIYVAPAKRNISFVVTVDEVEYKAIFSVENGAKTATKISYADIAANLKGEVEKDGQKEEVVLEGQVVTKVGETAQTGKYANSSYPVANTAIDILDFEDVAIEVADAFTANTGYDPATDSIYFESPVEVTVYWADVKKAAGAQLKGAQLKSIDLKKADSKATTYTGSISLTDKSAGVKIAESKTAYIYASIVAPADEKTKAKYSPNFIVDATPYKKVSVTFAYAQADKDDDDTPAIASITTIDTKKKTVIYSGAVTAEHANGLDAIIKELQYSTDGTTWYGVTGNEPQTVNGKTVNYNLTCKKLYEYVNGGSKTTLYFRIKGAAAVEAAEAKGTEGEDGYKPAVDAKNAYRATKAVKATIAAAKEAKAVKINVATGTLALKNGYDYAITDPADKGKNEPTFDTAEIITILPFNKDGKATRKNDQGEDVATYLKDTSDFVPTKKVTDNNKMFTNIKVKSVAIEDITDTSEDMYIWIRKSATVSKPAEKWVLMTIGKVAAAPTIKEDKNKFYAVQDAADTKGVIAAPEVSNASSDKVSGSYEYLIVDAADLGKIDWTTAKWTALTEKGVTVGKSKSKYSNAVGKKASDYVLKDGSVVLIRRAGVKSDNVLASNYIETTIVKTDIEIEVEKDGKKEKTTKALYVWKAYIAPANND